MTEEEFKSLEVYNIITRRVAPAEAYEHGVMCSWSSNIIFKTTSKNSSGKLVKDLTVEEFKEQRRINKYIEKQIAAIEKLQKLKEDFE